MLYEGQITFHCSHSSVVLICCLILSFVNICNRMLNAGCRSSNSLSVGKPRVRAHQSKCLCVVQQPSGSSSGGGVHAGGALPQLQHGPTWPRGIPGLMPLHGPSASLCHGAAHASTSRGSVVSALLTHGAAHTGGATLLIPKTEKLSPVQLYGPERSSLSGNCPKSVGFSTVVCLTMQI